MSEQQNVEKVTYQAGGGVTAFSVRRIQHDAWTEGHAACEWAGLAPDSSCPRHPSPYADASRFPSAGPAKRTTCGAGMDGDCYADGCPQNRDGEPMKSGRFCPLPPTGQIALREHDESRFTSAEQAGDDHA